MPALGADMEHGKLVEWLVKPGDFVHRGDMIAAVDTDKAVMDVESFEDGVVGEILVDVGATVPVGAPLARIVQTPAVGAERPGPAEHPEAERPGEAEHPSAERPGPPEPSGQAETPPVAPPVRHLAATLGVDTGTIRGTGRRGAITRSDVERAARGTAEEQVTRPEPVASRRAGAGRLQASPRARRVAAELGIDLRSVAGSGPFGAVTEGDVRRAGTLTPAPPTGTKAHPQPAAEPTAQASFAAPAPTPTPAPAVSAGEPAAADRAAALRKATGALMARSKQTIPHYYLGTTVDLTRALAWLGGVNESRPVSARLVPAVLLLKATALAARDFPEMNGFYTDDEFRQSPAVHLGVAVALRRGGLVAPAIHDADTLTLAQLSETLRDLVARARGGRLQRAEMADPTITVTNLGELGVETVFGVIYPPQVALVGFGRLRDEPYAREGLLGVRPVVSATLSADHRVSDGLRGARFLAMIDELLQEPEKL